MTRESSMVALEAATMAVGELDRAAEITGRAIDALTALGGITAANIALELLAARTSLLAAQSKAKRMLKVPR